MGTPSARKLHRHPDDSKPTEAMDPEQLIRLRLENAILKAPRQVTQTEVLDPRDLVYVADLPKVIVADTLVVEEQEDPEERPTVKMPPLFVPNSSHPLFTPNDGQARIASGSGARPLVEFEERPVVIFATNKVRAEPPTERVVALSSQPASFARWWAIAVTLLLAVAIGSHWFV